MAMNLATQTELRDPGGRAAGASMDQAAPPLEQIARHFPGFELLQCLGRGGMGVVYKARQKSLDRLVALKILAPELEHDSEFAERFAREARILAQLNHPNIVTIHDFGESDGMFYLVMEFVEGVNLRHLMTDQKLSPEEALAIVPHVCEALQYAHDHGVAHRDIKPENLLLDKAGRVKIADFGIARILDASGPAAVRAAGAEGSPPTAEGSEAGDDAPSFAAGTPRYMAPEQLEGLSKVDHRADIYSLGVVIYEMLTGELPGKPVVPPSRAPGGARIDVRLDEIVLRALEQEPERRYQHASEVNTAVATMARAPGMDPPGKRRSFGRHLILVGTREGRKRIRWANVALAFATLALLGAGSVAALSLLLFDGASVGAAMLVGAGVACLIIASGIWRAWRLPPEQLPSLDEPPAAATGSEPVVPPPGPKLRFAAGVTVLYVVLAFVFLFIRGGIDFIQALILLALIGGGLWKVGLFSNLFPAGWRRELAVTAFCLAVPAAVLALLGAGQLLAVAGGWPPRPVEAVALPLIWLGVLLLPWAGVTLWRSSKPEGAAGPPARMPGYLMAFLAVMVVIIVSVMIVFSLPAVFDGNAGRRAEAPVPTAATADGSFLAELGEGVAVELLAVSRHPSEGEPWWRPDGSPGEVEPFETSGRFTLTHDREHKAREFVVRVHGVPDDLSMIQRGFDPSLGSGGIGTPMKSGRHLADHRDFRAAFAPETKTTTLRVALAHDPWQTLVDGIDPLGVRRSFTVHRDGRLWSIILAEAVEAGDDIRLSIMHTVEKAGRPGDPSHWDTRIVAVDREGRERSGAKNRSAGAGDARHDVTTFASLTLAEVGEFRFQVRPYHWIEFRDIALDPVPSTPVEASPAASSGPGARELPFTLLRVEALPTDRLIRLHFERDSVSPLGFEVTQDVISWPDEEAPQPGPGYRDFRQKYWVGPGDPNVLWWRLPKEFTATEIQAAADQVERTVRRYDRIYEGASLELAHVKHRDGWTYVLLARVRADTPSRTNGSFEVPGWAYFVSIPMTCHARRSILSDSAWDSPAEIPVPGIVVHQFRLADFVPEGLMRN